MLPKNLAFVDIETTGGRSFYDRIIEIGIIRVQDGIITDTYATLINPNTHIPSEIEKLTGITAQSLEHAPSFNTVKKDILERLVDCYFVAHNVRFDYGFLKSEFARENISFSSKHFCTVRLSRYLFPQYRHHNLDAIIERFSIQCQNRHRAFDDAKVLYDFYQKLQSQIPLNDLDKAISKTMKKPSLPIKLKTEVLDALPEAPGVYIFYGKTPTFISKLNTENKNGTPRLQKALDTLMPLYVGKSKNIRQRVLSHFSQDIYSPSEMKISQLIESIDTIPTAGELGALLLESQLIKKLLPLYNKRSRIKRELIALRTKETKKGYLECFFEPVTHINPDTLDSFLGIFKSRKQAKSYLSQINSTHVLCEKLLGLENAKGACFSYRLEKCNGACVGIEKPQIYNVRLLSAVSQTRLRLWPFHGPIVVEERTLDNKIEYILLDKWCYLGKITYDTEGNKNEKLSHEGLFDLDIYNILSLYLKNPSNIRRIKPMSSEELQFISNQ